MSYGIDAREETFEEVTAFDKPMLFTCLRIDRDTVPKGLYVYEVRHDDDMQGRPVEIAERILVNHWGTLLSNKPIRLFSAPGGRSCRMIGAEDWNYEDVGSTLQKYLKQHPPQHKKRRVEER